MSCFNRRNKSSSALDSRPQLTKLEPVVSLQAKTENLLNKADKNQKIRKYLEDTERLCSPVKEYCNEVTAFPRISSERVNSLIDSKDQFSYLEQDLSNYSNKNSYNNLKDEHEEDLNSKFIEVNCKQTTKPEVKEKSTQKFQSNYIMPRIAKTYHDENLRHKPLPDVIDDPVYKALNYGKEPHAGGVLNVPVANSAIGWKQYRVPGPTDCSKLKIYRPKTAVDTVKIPKEERPKTSGNKYNEREKKILPINLAICWDLKLDDFEDESRKNTYTENNGSAAPAVFTMIPPKEFRETEALGSCEAVAERITQGIANVNVTNLPSQTDNRPLSSQKGPVNKEAIMECIKTTSNEKTDTPETFNSISTNAAEYARRNPKTAWSSEDTSKALSSKLRLLKKEDNKRQRVEKSSDEIQNRLCKSPLINKKKQCHSTPNINSFNNNNFKSHKSSTSSSKGTQSIKNQNGFLTEGKASSKDSKSRSCSACDNSNTDKELSEKKEFKAAFKAGVPNSESSHSSFLSAGKLYKPPKMRLPYAKKSYSIGTLVPPFSLWPEHKGQDYPEHWRLASVYQHSYKPINCRKRTLLAGVYQ